MPHLATNQRVQGYFETVVDHVPDHPRRQAACELEAGVGVYFDKPNLPLSVHQEVVAEDLKA